MSDQVQEDRPKPRRGLLLAGCLVPIVIVLVVLGLIIHQFRSRNYDEVGPIDLLEGEVDGRIVPWASPPFQYDGPGQLDAYMQFGCRRGLFQPDPGRGLTIGGRAVNCRTGFTSQLVPSPRTLLVHLPKGYDPQGDPLPVVFAFHGFGQRPHHVARALVEKFDQAQSVGKLPRVVLVMPDFSLSGNGMDDVRTPWEDVSGSWGVNSNVGFFADHFTKELLPWVLEHYNVRHDAAGTILLGGSMGGTLAMNFMIDQPTRFPNVAAFYPAIDLRYACNGSRTRDYEPSCYHPINSDDPNRALVVNSLQARLFTEKMFFYPVFDSDKWQGDVWKEDKPVWQRLRDHNPLDRLKTLKPDLHGVHIWYIVGDHDDFNIDAHMRVFNPVARELGAKIEPEEQIRPGRHDIPFIRMYLEEAVYWINNRLKASSADN